jgi:PTH1 family peptidyl-tRNA hydrolase
MILVAGLGNPTQRYASTRHNVGFWVIDEILKSLQYTSISKPQFHGELAKTSNFLFLKPQTYMNNSGQSVQAVASYFKPSELVVIHDDLDLPVGALRFKKGGGNGGHNGLKSIDACVGSDYIRVRIGIGRPKTKEDVINYVLEPFAKDELPIIHKVVAQASKAVLAMDKEELCNIKARFTCKPQVWDND